jgi:hypothetical protein
MSRRAKIIIVGKQFHLLKGNKLNMKGPLLNGLYQTNKIIPRQFLFVMSSRHSKI